MFFATLKTVAGQVLMLYLISLIGFVTDKLGVFRQADAKRVLIPVNHCENYIVGVPEQPISDLVAAAVQKVKALCAGEGCGKRVY